MLHYAYTAVSQVPLGSMCVFSILKRFLSFYFSPCSLFIGAHARHCLVLLLEQIIHPLPHQILAA